MSADSPLAKISHSVEPNKGREQGHLTDRMRAMQLMAMGEATRKGKEMGPPLQSSTHPTHAVYVSAILNL